ncbi:hypothetical protein GCM10027294_52830 [Marinactinospora endophytica]
MGTSATRQRSRRHEQISDTVAVLLRRCGENIADLAASLHQDRTNVSAKVHGRRLWTVDDLDGIAAHFHITLLELLSGPQAAVEALPRQCHTTPAGSQPALPAA